MTKDQFLASVALHDKIKGNYKETLMPARHRHREYKLQQATRRLIDLYEYLTNVGYDVFVHELLSGDLSETVKYMYTRRGLKIPKPSCFGRFAHLWIPEINMAIRFCNTRYGVRDEKLGQFINNSRPYCFLCVINPEDDPAEKFEKVLSDIDRYKKQGTANKRGVADTLVVPVRKKRVRLTTLQKA